MKKNLQEGGQTVLKSISSVRFRCSDVLFVSQSLISRTKDFDEAYKVILSKLSVFRERLLAADVPQPDILAKKSQMDQMQVSYFKLTHRRCSNFIPHVL